MKKICARPAVVLLVSVEQKLLTESVRDAKNLLTIVLADRSRNSPSKTKQVRGISDRPLKPLHFWQRRLFSFPQILVIDLYASQAAFHRAIDILVIRGNLFQDGLRASGLDKRTARWLRFLL